MRTSEFVKYGSGAAGRRGVSYIGSAHVHHVQVFPAEAARHPGLVNSHISNRMRYVDLIGVARSNHAAYMSGLNSDLLARECPLVSVKSGPVDTVVRVTRMHRPESKHIRGERGEIAGLSAQSAKRLVLYARNVSECLPYMITLTYPAEFPVDGRKVKRDLDVFRKSLKRKVPDLQGFWVLEFQRRGAPHFHLWVTDRVGEKWLSETWYRIVGSGDEKHLRAGTRIEAMRKKHALAAYASKYANKPEQKEVPGQYLSVGRFWGFFGGLRVAWVSHFVGKLSSVKATFLLRILRGLERSRGFRPRRGQRWRRGVCAGPRAWSGGVSWGCSLPSALVA